ncbi:hypothetical protein [Maribacter sp. 2307ULW6-5]|uniref:hypothetical protein n=1 Tax=Maribacter sp. 2307ULW6-5 TaxID=3386275 RepID=UPI0039BD063F
MKRMGWIAVMAISIIMGFSGCGQKEVQGQEERVYYIDVNEDIVQVALSSSGFQVRNISNLSSAPKVNGNIAVAHDGREPHLFYLSAKGELVAVQVAQDSYNTSSLAHLGLDLNGKTEISSIIKDGVALVYLLDANNDVHELKNGDDGAYRSKNITMTYKAPKAQQSPAILATKAGIKLLFRDVNDEVTVIDMEQGKIANWTKETGGPQAKDKVATMRVNEQEHVFFKGTDGEIEHYIHENGRFRKDSWTKLANRWTQLAFAPLAAGPPTAMFINGKENIFYLDSDGDIQNLLYDNGKFKCHNWSSSGDLSPAKTHPVVEQVVY